MLHYFLFQYKFFAENICHTIYFYIFILRNIAILVLTLVINQYRFNALIAITVIIKQLFCEI